MKALGIDIGGSALKGAPVDTKTGELLAERLRIATPEPLTPAEMAEAVARLARHFKWRGAIGVGFPGVIEGSTIWTSANLHPKFVGCDGAKLFGEATGRRVAMINDAAAAGVAEMRFGAGRGFMGKTLLLTLGTGVGSCMAYQGIVTPLELGHFPWQGGKSAEDYVAASVREEEDLSWEEWGARLGEYIGVLERAVLAGAHHHRRRRELEAQEILQAHQHAREAGAGGVFQSGRDRRCGDVGGRGEGVNARAAGVIQGKFRRRRGSTAWNPRQAWRAGSHL